MILIILFVLSLVKDNSFIVNLQVMSSVILYSIILKCIVNISLEIYLIKVNKYLLE